MDRHAWNGGTGGVGNRVSEFRSRGACSIGYGQCQKRRRHLWVQVGAGLWPARRSAVHCSAPLERARVGRRNTRISIMHAQRTVGAPVALCASRTARKCSVMLILCRTGAVAEGAWRVRCGVPSVSSSSTASLACSFPSPRPYLGFFG